MMKVMTILMMIMLEVNYELFNVLRLIIIFDNLADLISLLDVNPHNEHPGIILESEFFDEADFALRYSNIQRRVVSARIGNVGMYHIISINIEYC